MTTPIDDCEGFCCWALKGKTAASKTINVNTTPTHLRISLHPQQSSELGLIVQHLGKSLISLLILLTKPLHHSLK
jgi:hypothetical protein